MTTVISIIAGNITIFAINNHCKSYLRDAEIWPEDTVAVIKPIIQSNCGCDDLCRDLNIVPIPRPISYIAQITCKKNATTYCRSSVQDLLRIWVQVPAKEDTICFDAYNRTKIWAASCH